MKDKEITEALGRALQNERFSTEGRAAVLHAIQSRKPLGQSRLWAFVLALCLLVSSAIAASIQYSPRVDALTLADRTIHEKYGFSPESTALFHRDIQQEGDAIRITYRGNAMFSYVLGAYTVTVRQGKAQASWSRDGEDTGGGFEADAWGQEQVNELLRLSAKLLQDLNRSGRLGTDVENRDILRSIREKAEEKAAAAGQPYVENEPIDADLLALSRQRSAAYTECKSRAKITIPEAEEIMWQALEQQFDLWPEDMYPLGTRIADQQALYTMYGDLPVFRFHLMTRSNPYLRSDGAMDTKCGTYEICVNAETGVVENISFTSEYWSVIWTY